MKLSLIRSSVVSACLVSPRLGLVLSSWEKQELWKQVHERESSDPFTQGEGEEADVIGGDYRILSEMREALQVELCGLKSCRFQNLLPRVEANAGNLEEVCVMAWKERTQERGHKESKGIAGSKL